jgi:diacylglycerol O-acyltransferase
VGSFAVLLKVHHAAVDVAHGNQLTMLLHDISATPPVPRRLRPGFPSRRRAVWR